MRFHLRTLLIAGAIMPPMLALAWLHGTPVLIILILALCYMAVVAVVMFIGLLVLAALEVVLNFAERIVSRR